MECASGEWSTRDINCTFIGSSWASRGKVNSLPKTLTRSLYAVGTTDNSGAGVVLAGVLLAGIAA